MGILFTTLMGFLLTITMGFLFTITIGIQFTISTITKRQVLEAYKKVKANRGSAGT